MTARHCLANRQPAGVDAIVGAGNICRGSVIDGERIGIRQIIRDPHADRADLMLTERLATEPAPVLDSVPTGTILLAFGWGRRSAPGSYPCHPKAIMLRTLDPAACTQRAGAGAVRLADLQISVGHQWCAVGAAGANTCVGDSGGPAYLMAGDRAAVVGITSWGEGCRPDDPGFYTFIAPEPR